MTSSLSLKGWRKETDITEGILNLSPKNIKKLYGDYFQMFPIMHKTPKTQIFPFATSQKERFTWILRELLLRGVGVGK